jgi:succinate-semialdehyde dehydrogenase / glutarate-semialdehyde dehydrogenase
MGSHAAPVRKIDLRSLLKQPSLLDDRGLIAGEWKYAKDKKTFPVYDPSNAEVLLECANFGEQDFIRAIEEADLGYQHFSTISAKERGEMLKRWNALILSNIEDRGYTQL